MGYYPPTKWGPTPELLQGPTKLSFANDRILWPAHRKPREVLAQQVSYRLQCQAFRPEITSENATALVLGTMQTGKKTVNAEKMTSSNDNRKSTHLQKQL